MCWNAGKAAQNSHKQLEQTLTVCVFVPVFHLLQTVSSVLLMCWKNLTYHKQSSELFFQGQTVTFAL